MESRIETIWRIFNKNNQNVIEVSPINSIDKEPSVEIKELDKRTDRIATFCVYGEENIKFLSEALLKFLEDTKCSRKNASCFTSINGTIKNL